MVVKADTEEINHGPKVNFPPRKRSIPYGKWILIWLKALHFIKQMCDTYWNSKPYLVFFMHFPFCTPPYWTSVNRSKVLRTWQDLVTAGMAGKRFHYLGEIESMMMPNVTFFFLYSSPCSSQSLMGIACTSLEFHSHTDPLSWIKKQWNIFFIGSFHPIIFRWVILKSWVGKIR